MAGNGHADNRDSLRPLRDDPDGRIFVVVAEEVALRTEGALLRHTSVLDRAVGTKPIDLAVLIQHDAAECCGSHLADWDPLLAEILDRPASSLLVEVAGAQLPHAVAPPAEDLLQQSLADRVCHPA